MSGRAREGYFCNLRVIGGFASRSYANFDTYENWAYYTEVPASAVPARTERPPRGVVYCMCMARTNIDLDDEACRAVMERYQLRSKRDAVNFALRTLAAEPLTVEEARALRGSGWEGDLDEMRLGRPA
jgi:Arc/MetJ family transcription regulator